MADFSCFCNGLRYIFCLCSLQSTTCTEAGENQGIDDAGLQQLLLDQRTTTGTARLEVLNEIQKFLLENAYEVLLVSPGWSFLTLYKSNVEGFQRKHVVIPIFNDVKIN